MEYTRDTEHSDLDAGTVLQVYHTGEVFRLTLCATVSYKAAYMHAALQMFLIAQTEASWPGPASVSPISVP